MENGHLKNQWVVALAANSADSNAINRSGEACGFNSHDLRRRSAILVVELDRIAFLCLIPSLLFLSLSAVGALHVLPAGYRRTRRLEVGAIQGVSSFWSCLPSSWSQQKQRFPRARRTSGRLKNQKTSSKPKSRFNIAKPAAAH